MENFRIIEDDIVKLPDGRIIDTALLEHELSFICHYVMHVVIVLKDETLPIALIFPDKKLYKSPDYFKSPEEGCFCPRSLGELGKCLTGCTETVNRKLKNEYTKLDKALIINHELSTDDYTLNADKSINRENVLLRYKNYVSNLYGGHLPEPDETFVIDLTKETE